MDPTGTVAMTGAVAVLISAFTGLGGWMLARRAQASAERREEDLRSAPYLQQLQDWSMKQMKEEADRRAQDRLEFQERLGQERADCDRRVARVEVDQERKLRDQEVQWGAKLLVAQRTIAGWRRWAEGEGDRPP